MLLVSEQTMRTHKLDRAGRRTDVSAARRQPGIVLGASGARLSGEYYVLPARHRSRCALRGCFHAALLLFVSRCHGRGVVVCAGNRIGTDRQQ